MVHNLLFGAAYYPEYMPYDRLALDIQMMKDANMNGTAVVILDQK